MTAVLRRVTRPASLWTRPGLHLLCYAAVLASILLVAPLDSAFSSDDGAYAIQVRSLNDDGAWELARPVPVVPVDNEGLVNGWRAEAGPVAYGQHPVYVQLLRAGGALFGEPLGMRLVVLLGALLAPWIAWRLSQSLDTGWPVAAFWLTAFSPMLVNANGLWAHPPTVAIGGAMLLAIAATRGRPIAAVDTAVVIALGVLGVLIRTEMALWCLAVAVAWLVIRRSARSFVSAAALVGATALTVWGEQVVRGSLVHGRLESPIVGNEATGWVASRLQAGWHVLFDPSHRGGLVGLLALFAAVLVVLGAIKFRRDGVAGARPLFLFAAALMAVRLLLGDGELSTGLVSAWPLAVAGVIIGWRATTPERFLAAVGAVFVLAVLVTQHRDGGGLEWGGRYFSPVIVAVAVAGSGGVRRLWAGGRPLRILVVLMLVLPTAAGFAAAGAIRNRNADIVAHVAASGSPVVITEEQALPRLAWATVPEVSWFRATPDDIESLLDVMDRSGVARLTVQGVVDVDLLGLGYRVERVAPGLRVLTRIE